MKRLISIALVTIGALGFTTLADAHCQIPCGIYNDELRVQLIEEHIGTIEKSMNQITALSNEPVVNANQLVRWVDNKEAHAQEIQDIITAYFMAQRIKPVPASEADAHKMYANQLMLAHHILVHAMKTKQGTDLSEIENLRSLVKKFRTAYFGEEGGHGH
jgi:nickel superoxide dismutase